MRRVRMSGKSEEKAVELVSTIDEERATFIQKYFGKQMSPPLSIDDQFQDWRRSCGAGDSESNFGFVAPPNDEYSATLATTRFDTTTGKAWMINP